MQSHRDHTSFHLSVEPAEGMVKAGDKMKLLLLLLLLMGR
jgi:hypothetical protein